MLKRNRGLWGIWKPLLIFIGGAAIGVALYRIYIRKISTISANPYHAPDNPSVILDSTNLPIVFINTDGEVPQRDNFIIVRMKIVDNGENVNYADTLVHSNQHVDYEGYTAIKYRGKSSYERSPKKAFAIRPLGKDGKKRKSAFLGMREAKKWAMNALYLDKSMIRDALTFELARPYMDFVPEVRYCEVIMNGIYYGVYLLSEQNTPDRLMMQKPGRKGNEMTGGYIIQIDRRAEALHLPEFFSKKWEKMGYCYEYPKFDKLSNNQKQYLQQWIEGVEDVICKGDYAEIEQKVDVPSMVDYQLVSEFSHNQDAYELSTYIYKYRNDENPKLKFGLWDYDLAYGNTPKLNYARVDNWVYDIYLPTNIPDFWWSRMMQDKNYSHCVKLRWKQYRRENFSDEHIERVIDSLTNVLTSGNAEKRNAEAWDLYTEGGFVPKYFWPQKYVSSSYEEEIAYLREWVRMRLSWMDRELLDE